MKKILSVLSLIALLSTGAISTTSFAEDLPAAADATVEVVTETATAVVEEVPAAEAAPVEAMPAEAQMSPVFAIEAADFDKDGHMDIFLGGNFYKLKPEMGRLDGFNGGYFKGDGKGKFQYINHIASGLKVKGEVRDAAMIDNVLIVARNNASVQFFKINKK